MLICDKHWLQMEEKVKELRIHHLCSSSAQDAAKYFIDSVRGPEDVLDRFREDAGWDPLVIMNFNFMKRVLLTIGWVEDCPLCIVRGDFEAHNTETGGCGEADCPIRISPGEESWDLQWISGCAEVILDEATRRGLVTIS